MNANVTRRKENRGRPATWILPTIPYSPRLPLPPPILRVLAQVRRRYLSVQLSEGIVLVGIALLSLWLLQGVWDWIFNLPWALRLVFLIIDAVLFFALSYWFILVPVFQRLNQQTAALLVERTMPQFRTELISAVQLAAGGHGCIQGSVELVQRLLSRVGDKIGGMEVARKVVKTDALKRLLKYLVLALVVTGGAFGWFYPKSVILLRRVLLSREPLPTMTRVYPVSRDVNIPAGSELTLSARAEGVIPKSGRVMINFEDGHQETVSALPKGDKPEVFALTLPNVHTAFRYHFEINDGVGPDFYVTPRILPSLVSCRFTQIYPEYTGLGEAVISSGNLSLLAGGRLRIEGEATQPLKTATLELEGLNQKLEIEISGSDRRTFKTEIPVPKDGLTAISLQMVDTKGESSLRTTTRLDIFTDKPPVASLTLPKMEKITALADSKLSLAYSVKDDYGVKKVVLHYEVFRPTSPDQEPVAVERGEFPLKVPSGRPAPFLWDLSGMIPPLTIGSFVRYWIEAEDNNIYSGPGIGSSRKKTVTIVSEESKRMELLEMLGKKASEIERLYKSQQKINDKTDTTIQTK
ncbi:MAG: DUF4175 family protein [Verrucomicrobiota bacterium]